jgi:predicted membrane-bound dolichyl-phosphate-mannose-protein mannosyltransferase
MLPDYTVAMLNIWLTVGYFAALGLVVASRDRFLDNDLVVVGVAAAVLFAGLGLWVFIAQSHRDN